MANTTIQLKYSVVSSNTPSSLANGEIAINGADGKLFYRTPGGTIQSIQTYPGPAGLNKEIQFNDAGSAGANAGLTFDKSTGVFNAPIVASSNNGNGTNFKVGDDAWIGDVNLADTLRISGQQNVNNAYIVFGATNANTLGRAGSGPLTYTGDFKATGLVSGNELTSTQSSGSEGGQVNLAIPASGTTLVGSVTIDVYGNQLRFFQGDSAKGAYIDLTAVSAGVGTDLLNPTTTTDSTARTIANAAFAKANSANVLAQAAFNQANTANSTDYTTISATAGVYGNASHVTVTTLTANGRVSSITNTAIAISADAITSGTLSNTRGGTGTTSSTGTGAVVLNTSPTLSTPTVNRVDWPSSGYAPPGFTTRSTGTKLNLYPAISGSTVDYAIGIDGATLWSSVPAAANTYYFKWYGGETNIASLDGTGKLTVVTANVVATTTSTSNTTGALTVGGGVGVKGNVVADNVYVGANPAATIPDVLALAIALG